MFWVKNVLFWVRTVALLLTGKHPDWISHPPSWILALVTKYTASDWLACLCKTDHLVIKKSPQFALLSVILGSNLNKERPIAYWSKDTSIFDQYFNFSLIEKDPVHLWIFQLGIIIFVTWIYWSIQPNLWL